MEEKPYHYAFVSFVKCTRERINSITGLYEVASPNQLDGLVDEKFRRWEGPAAELLGYRKRIELGLLDPNKNPSNKFM